MTTMLFHDIEITRVDNPQAFPHCVVCQAVKTAKSKYELRCQCGETMAYHLLRWHPHIRSFRNDLTCAGFTHIPDESFEA